MSSPISPRQWKLLSAYLDEQLEPKEKEKLEQMLSGYASLRAALDRLRTGRGLLQRLPERPVPHHFTLTRQMAAQTTRTLLTKVMGYSSLAAMMALVVMVAAQLTTLAPRLSFGAQAPLMEREAAKALTAPPAPIIVWGLQFGKGGSGGGFGGGEPAPGEGAPYLLEPPAGDTAPLATPGVETRENPAEPPSDVLRTPAPHGPILGIRPTYEVGGHILAPTAAPPGSLVSRAEPFVLSRIFIIIEGAALTAALVFGIFWLWKRKRR